MGSNIMLSHCMDKIIVPNGFFCVSQKNASNLLKYEVNDDRIFGWTTSLRSYHWGPYTSDSSFENNFRSWTVRKEPEKEDKRKQLWEVRTQKGPPIFMRLCLICSWLAKHRESITRPAPHYHDLEKCVLNLTKAKHFPPYHPVFICKSN